MGNCNECQENNIPTVNEQSLECCELISANCVKTSSYNSFFKIGIGKSLTEVIDAIAKVVKKLSDSIESQKIYDTYIALLTQSGTSAPTSTVLRNELSSNIVWTRLSAGKYRGTLTGAFTSKTVITLGAFDKTWGEDVKAFRVDNNTIAIETGNSTDFINDGVLSSLPIDIKIYY